LVAAAVFGLAACSNSTPGNATPGNAGGGSTPTSSNASSASTTSLQPCDLISADEAGQLQLTQSGPVNEGAARACKWEKPVDINGQNGFAVEVGIRDSQGLTDINAAGYTITSDNVGGHQGKQASLNIGGSCFVALAVGSSARVDIQVAGNTDTTSSCLFANQVAKFVEPHLPGGGS
jgi:hypothetical protein